MSFDLESALRAHYQHDHQEWDVLLNRWVAGELNAHERERFENHREDCPECAALLREYRMMQPVWDATEPSKRFRWALWSGIGIGAIVPAVAMLAVLFVVRSDESSFSPKGDFVFELGVKRNERVFRAQPETRYQEGDQVGFFLTNERSGYLSVSFIEQDGAVQSLFPADELSLAPVGEGASQRLPAGAELDPQTACEWIVALYSTAPVHKQRLAERLEEAYHRRSGCTLDLEPLSPFSARVFEVRE